MLNSLDEYLKREIRWCITRPRFTVRRRIASHPRLKYIAENLESRVLLSVAFSGPITTSVPGTPVADVVVDLNGDGKPDLAVISQPAFVSILLGAGDGTFKPAGPPLTPGSSLTGIVAGDFNGDGKIDLVTADGGSNSVDLLLGNGDGTFQAPVSIPIGFSPAGLVSADFNGDGKLDLVVVGSGGASILLGNGDGTFQPAAPIIASLPSLSLVALGDFNGDGIPDVVAADSVGTLYVLLGNATGGFSIAGNTSRLPGAPSSIAVADLNGDGKLDLVDTDKSDNVVDVLLGNGDGTFQTAFGNTASGFPSSVAVGDFNGDGKPDLVVGSLGAGSDQNISIFQGTGNGITFGSPINYAAVQPGFVAAADVNGDGKLDVISLARFGGSVNVYLGRGDGTLPGPINLTGGGGGASLLADLNGDHILDIASTQGSSVTVWTGLGNGTFALPTGFPVGGGPSAIAAGDLNGDGFPELLTADTTGNSVTVLKNNGGDGFGFAGASTVGPSPHALVVADFNGDGKLDVVTANGDDTLSILFGNGDTTFQPAITIPAPGNILSLAAADVNGDGKMDLVLADSTGFVEVMLGQGNGGFLPAVPYAVGGSPQAVALGDFNGDGKTDIAVVNGSPANTVNVLLGNGDGTFGPAISSPTGSSPVGLVAGDFNGDGQLDLAVVDSDDDNGAVSVMIGLGNGSFQPPIDIVTGYQPVSVVAADLNADGKTDLITGNASSQTELLNVTTSPGDAVLPKAAVDPQQPAPTLGASTYQFTVTFTDNVAVSAASIAGSQVFVNGPSGYAFSAMLLSGNLVDGPSVQATYSMPASGGMIDAAGNGLYTVSITLPGAADTSGNLVPVGTIGNFTLNVVGNAQPDLTLSNLSYPPGAYSPGSTLPVTVVENNIGNGAAGRFDIAFDLSTDNVYGNPDDVPLGTLNQMMLPAGQSTPISINLTIPATVPPGNYYLVAEINSKNTVAESDTSNNVLAGHAADITLPAPATPAPTHVGGLEPSFGVGGLASHDVGFTTTSGLVVQPDGKSVIAGIIGTPGSENFGLTRFNADGSVDTAFGNGGAKEIDFQGTDDEPTSVVLLSDGRILEVGTSKVAVGGQTVGSEFALALFDTNGQLDPTFGNGTGRVLTSFSASPTTTPSTDVANAVIVGPGNEIFIVGSSTAGGHGQDFAIAAYNPDGTPATSFNGTGKELLDFSGGDDSANAVVLQPNGDLVLAGSSANPATSVTSIALVRLLANGTLDAGFGTKGRVLSSLRGVDDEATSIALGPKGVIVVGGLSATGSFAAGNLEADFAVLRFTEAGKLDRTFARTGDVITTFGQDSLVTRVLVQPDGSIIASGKSLSGISSTSVGQLGIAIARYTSAGALDTSFNGAGKTIISLSGQTATSSVSHRPTFGPADTVDDLRQLFEMLVHNAQGIIATTPGGNLLIAGNSGGYTDVGQLVIAGIDLAGSLSAKFPRSVVGGTPATITIGITEHGSSLASATVSVQVFISDTSGVVSGDTPVLSKGEKIKLKSAQSKSYKFKITLPKSIRPGSYYLVTEISSAAIHDLNLTNNIAFQGPFVVA